MKKKLLKFATFVLFIVVILSLQSCGKEKYTVWTDDVAYSDWISIGGTEFPEGSYSKNEFSNTQWSDFSNSLSSYGRHKWTETEINNWLLENGLDATQAAEEASWLILTNHGLIIIRTGNTMHLMVK